MTTLTWAHRGASAMAPENTLPAFEKAIELGADGIELDLQRTADGALVVCHDETVDRCSDGSGAIIDLDLDTLRSLNFDNGMPGFTDVRIPLLEEVFELVRPTSMTINVELKDSEERYWGMDLQARDLAASMGMADRIIWSSFNHWSLRHLRESDSGARIGLLFAEPLLDPWSYARQLDAQAIHPSWQALAMTPDAVERCHEAGVAVHAWTVDDPQLFDRLAADGVDALITNTPEVGRR